MFGWRARIGYISPTVMEVLPFEFYRFAPDGVGLVGMTCGIDDWRPEEFEKGLAQVKGAAGYLGSRNVDFIIHGGGPLVVARGKGYEETIVNEIEAASGVPATTGVRAGMEALRHMGAQRIAIASCYPPGHNEALKNYLGSFGFEVVRAEGTNMPFKDIQKQSPAEILAFTKQVLVAAGRCDAVYLPCPQWQGAQAVDAIERETCVTAVAYTHANFFQAFRKLGIDGPIVGHGRLLASLSDQEAAR
jgi:maleate cis-trans isomerase